MMKGIKRPTKSMEYWLDGYNLVLRQGWNREGGIEAARARLLRAITPLGAPCRVYFDARGAAAGERGRDESPSSLVRPLYIRDRAADDAIADDLRGAPKGSTTVVTDDRELRGRAKQLGALTLGVEKFLEKLALAATPVRKPPSKSSRAPTPGTAGPAPAGRDVRLSKREVDEWMKLFGFEEGDGERPPTDSA